MQNLVILTGRVGNDPETRRFNNGDTITNFRLATSTKWTDKQTGEKREHTEWHTIAVPGPYGENVAKYCKKGSLVSVVGSIRYKKFTKQDKTEAYFTEIRANTVDFLNLAKDTKAATPAPVTSGEDTGAIPF